MYRQTLLLTGSALVCAAMANAAAAVPLAFTDFNASTIVGVEDNHIKTNLGWVLDGLEDPGDMVALNAGGNDQAIFDGNDFVRDIFIPGLNTGNGNTFWTTDVSLTVAAGSTVTLEDVTLNSVSVSGGQAENVNRRNDYTLTLLDPSDGIVEEVTIADTIAGTGAGQPFLTFDFADVALSDPGTYTLRIKGGDFTGTNETGNHTGLDNLSINGTVSTGGPAADLSGDGDVDDEDLGLFFSAFTGPDNGPSLDPRADLSGDGDVDDEDLGLAFSEFTGPLGPPQGPASVPEPTSLALLGLGGLLVARRRR